MPVANNMDACTRTFMLIFVHLCCLTLLTYRFGICTGIGSSSEVVKCIPSEREALLRFKRYLKDPSNRLSSWNASNPNCCRWPGVVCSNVTAHVLQLHLNTSFPAFNDFVTGYEYDEAEEAYERSMFGGEINHSLVDLKHLNYLDLSGNAFGGMPIPSFLCAITTLTYLNLSHAGFYGKIPHRIGNLSNLRYLGLALAANGTIPYQIGNLTNLLHLDLQSYELVAENLGWLSSLSSLQYLDLSYANLSKSFDWLQTMQALPSLVELRLQECTFSDYNQPTALNFSSLVSLSISVAPKWIFRLNKLASLKIESGYYSSRNRDPIPHGIQNLTLLENLDLSGNSFSSSIPNWLYGLHHLKFLNLRGNNLNGTISNFLGNLTSLISLDLSNNQLVGVIPYQIGNLTNLLYLDLGSYYDNEPLVAKNLGCLSGLSSLQYLDLSYANLSKSFDWLQTMEALPFLVELRLQGCAFSDYKQPLTLNFSSLVSLSISIAPKWIFGLNKLVSLQFASNYDSSLLSGPIPDGVQNLTLLENLDLSGNSFSSSIPDWLYGLHHLKFLNLRYNKLHGTISDAVGNLTSLVSLDLSSNQLEGKIPNSLRNLCNLREIFFSYLKCNQQISEILEILTPCVSRGLRILEASSTQISGHLPDQFGMFKNLVTLDFYNNSIIGTLPQTLGKLSSLKFLDLSVNKLSGNPFEILASIPKLSSLYIDHNQFQGVVQEDDLANFTALWELSASGNNLNLKVDRNWQPNFQLTTLEISSWQLGPNSPSWIQSQKYLQYLDMSNTGILDSIPTWFWKTFRLVGYLNLSHNHIHGELPNTLKNLESIEIVDLSSNCLHGKLPYLPVDVVWLDLSNNSFSGSMTDFHCQKHDKPKYLQFLNLASNNLSGEIPNCWKMWPYLVDVNLRSNNFIGNLPSSMGSLAELQSLHISNNMLLGEFPLILKNTSKLISLDLGENNLAGFIPTWVGERLINLKILRLRSNKFSGSIPNGICGMKLLQDLDLAKNNLSGSIPNCFNHLSAMVRNKSKIDSFIVENITRSSIISVLVWVKGIGVEYRNILGLVKNIDLSDNKLSGEIPGEITKLSGLIFLNLSKNQFSGHIPQNIGNMESLESIDFSRNQLSGEIPSTITNLSFLSKLDLSHNHLKGKIPTGTQLQSFEASNFIGNNLCGPPLPVNCTLDEKVPDANHNNKESTRHEVNWFFVSMAFGFIVGFWGVVAPLFIYRSWRYTYFRFLDDMRYKLQSYW